MRPLLPLVAATLLAPVMQLPVYASWETAVWASANKFCSFQAAGTYAGREAEALRQAVLYSKNIWGEDYNIKGNNVEDRFKNEVRQYIQRNGCDGGSPGTPESSMPTPKPVAPLGGAASAPSPSGNEAKCPELTVQMMNRIAARQKVTVWGNGCSMHWN